MKSSAVFIVAFLLTVTFINTAFAQKAFTVDVVPRIAIEEITQKCKELKVGEIVLFREPDFPSEALIKGIEGSSKVTIQIDKIGSFIKIVSAEGKSPFVEKAISAAQKIKFKPTLCDNQAIEVNAVITYKFSFDPVTEKYFMPEKIREFSDVTNQSEYFEAISSLTENYKISFGYDDNKFHEEAPLTRGDFAHFLRLTLDFLFSEVKSSKKIPSEIKLVSYYNPYKLTNTDQIKDYVSADRKFPWINSSLVLFQKYNIVLVDEDLELKSNMPIMRNEVIDIWSHIFEKDALPIYFDKSTDDKQLMKRGEFALFLQESLRVLSYKVLP